MFEQVEINGNNVQNMNNNNIIGNDGHIIDNDGNIQGENDNRVIRIHLHNNHENEGNNIEMEN